MTTLKHHSAADHLHRLLATLDDYASACLDPDFDAGAEELERQFAELRLTFAHN